MPSTSSPLVGASHGLRAGCLLAILSLWGLVGCTPRVIVHSRPGVDDPGIRFYRPKPFLKVEPAEVALEKNQTSIVPGVVRISLVYLPDFSEEYALEVRSGLGIANVGIKLTDGWNLTEISQELDSQTDENVKAVASLLSAVGDIPTAGNTGVAPEVSFTVPAHNVPIGLYESVIGRDSRGCKRLYGFRYVGFAPFANCPLEMGGGQFQCCNDPAGGLYGLSFIGGQMVFVPLAQMAVSPAVEARGLPAGRTSDIAAGAAFDSLPPANAPADNVGNAEPLSGPSPTAPAAAELNRIEVRLRAALAEMFPGVGEVRATHGPEGLLLRVSVAPGVPPLAVRQAIESWSAANLEASLPVTIDLIPAT